MPRPYITKIIMETDMHFEINAGHLTPTYVSLVASTNEACIPSTKSPGVMIYQNIAPHHAESLLKLLEEKGIPYKMSTDGTWQRYNGASWES
ncbi:hypothetical protein JT27_00395 [Alcaligenes faecalis]|nr:hypothetical protein JT27_00395 [Alcaligenes faecalis]